MCSRIFVIFLNRICPKLKVCIPPLADNCNTLYSHIFKNLKHFHGLFLHLQVSFKWWNLLSRQCPRSFHRISHYIQIIYNPNINSVIPDYIALSTRQQFVRIADYPQIYKPSIILDFICFVYNPCTNIVIPDYP